jgi:1-phosphatidylinositol-3-phosphate 5-kinase
MASLSTQAERENLNEALDQIHSAAYQSDSLTVFNEFTHPPASSAAAAAENDNAANDLNGGLSGLYSRFRASVGGVKDIVAGSGRPSDIGGSETPAAKSPSAHNTSFPSLDSQQSHPNSVHGSRVHSPAVGALSPGPEASTAFRGPRLPSKPASVSSKASVSSTPAIKSPVPGLTKADPAVTEITVNAVKDSLVNSQSNSTLSSNAFQGVDQPNLERSEGSLRSSLSEASGGPSSRRSYSPVLTGKPFSHPYRDGQGLPESTQIPRASNETSDYDKLKKSASGVVDRRDLPELDTSFASTPRKARQLDSISQDTQSERNLATVSSTSLTADDSTAPTSANNSLAKVSHDESSAQDGRTPTTLGTSVSLVDRESTTSSRPSLDRPQNKLLPRVSQSRLPGYVMSRASSSETATTRSASLEQSNNQFSRNRPPTVKVTDTQNNNFSQLRNNLLSKEFWMRDENAKDCFLCGEPFTTFRRKHHCRTCGQIFDSKCTVLIPGAVFGQSGSIRVCKPCEDMINSRDDDSSDFSDNEQSPVVWNQRLSEIHSTGISGRLLADDDDTASVMSQSIEHVMKTPTMAIPATRRTAEGSNRLSAVLEIESDRPLTRPTSSRSLRSSAGLRNHPMGHKRHHSRQQYIRSFKSYHDDRAPFQRRHLEDINQQMRLPAFHRDSIIDPDLAQYLSDDASSGDEQPNLLSVVSDGSLPKNGGGSEKTTFGGFLAAVKKGRSRFGDRSIANGVPSVRDADDGSISSSRAVNLPRAGRRRNLSVASSIHQRSSPRASKDNTLHFHDHHSPSPALSTGLSSGSGFKMTRSSSMRGAAAPAIEMNRVSLEHVHKLLRQLLKDSSVPNAGSWETALLPILLKANDDVQPDVQSGDDMDIRHYVKLKKVPGGRPGDTSYISGLVFTKNLALKSMPRSIPRPNILIITFALEYARHQQHFMSLEPVIRQQREFLENLVSRIAALRPNLLLVEKNVSGLALELLEKANIATAYNVKPSVLEAVSRCTQTRIITSMDKLVRTPAPTGSCGSFDLKTYVHNGRRKTYMYISGCPKELGCTIVLRGADNDVLVKVKRITEFMVYVVYNLKLETCLIRDEFAQLTTSDQGNKKGVQTVDRSGVSKLITSDDSPADQSASMSDAADKAREGPSGDLAIATETEVPDDVPMPTFYEDMVQKHETKILSASPCVGFEPPYLLMRARELERRLAYLKRLRDRDLSGEQDQAQDEKIKSQRFLLITPEMIHESPDGASSKVKEVLHAVHDAEYDRALHNYQTQKRQWEAYLSGNSNLFDPYAHQNIVVLYSLVCTTTSIPCSGPDIFALDFYNEHESDNRVFEADCTLGQYVEDLCLEANTVCEINGCEKKLFEHHRQYVHGQGQISIFVQPYPCKLRGLQNTILMWSCCKICGNETQVMPMSENTWRYSFGKYLELSFWSKDIHARAGVCPHDNHRDHLRYFGFKDMALRIHYDPITLLEIIVPRTRVTWKVENDLKLRNEVYKKSERRINKFMASVKARLKSINVESVMPEKVEDCRRETEVLMKKATEDHASLIRQLQEKYMNSRYWEIIPLNEVLRSAQEKVVEWDTSFAEFEKNFFPSEKDIRRLAALQLKKIFLDKDASVTSLTSAEEPPTTPTEPGAEETNETLEKPRPVRRMTLSPEKAQDVLVSVVEEHSGRVNAEGTPDGELTAQTSSIEQGKEASAPRQIAATRDVQHLDLAVPSSFSGGANASAQPSPESLADSRCVTPSLDSDYTLSNPPSPGALALPERVQRLDSAGRAETNAHAPQVTTPSGIPRLAEGGARRGRKMRSPPLFRTYSQPIQLSRQNTNSSTGPMAALKSGFGNSNGKIPGALPSPPPLDSKSKPGDKKLPDRLGLSALKPGKLASGHSFIPRSVPKKLKSPRVSSLARHFEQLSREFEKERQRERLQRAAKSKHSRAYPMASSKPIVEVYKNVREAVEEREPSGDGEDFFLGKPPEERKRESEELSRTDTNISIEPVPETAPVTPAEPAESVAATNEALSEVDEVPSDEDRDNIHLVDSPEELAKLSPEDDIDLKDLPKHERSTLVRMLTNFWAERSASGWQPLDYPLKVSDHVFTDCDIIVREDEPSSLIAFALDSQDYKNKLASIQEHYNRLDDQQAPLDSDVEAQDEVRVEHALLRATGTHLKYQFQEGQAKMLCKVFYAEQFDALRRKCGVAARIVESLSRCAKWDSKGGKTKSLFLKTLDDRFVLKSLSAIETQAFLKFAPAYFQIMSEALFHELPSAIAKMFGFYQVIIKNPATGVEFNWFLLMMENLFYDRVPTRIFDLKGSMRNRKVQSTGERNEVLLDENMVDFIYETPLFTREHSKKLLSQSVWNDTLFLGRQNVMDYSLMIAIDEPRQELVVGIIDCIRTYTWDKKLESWIKDRGFAGGGKNRPTVTSPKEYKSRFREAMARYVLQAPK